MMLKKRERIEDDFMSYGSGQEQSKKKSESSMLSKLIQFLLVVVLLGVVGFMGLFGYRYLQQNKAADTTPLPQPVAKNPQLAAPATPAAAVAQKGTTTESSVHPTAAQNTDAPKQRMYTQEEMQEIVKMLMAQMQNSNAQKAPVATPAQTAVQQPQEKTAKAPAQKAEKQDALVAALNLAEVDEIDDVEPEVSGKVKNADSVKAKKVKNGKKVDHYNKVVVKKSANSYDDLANLSMQIGDIVSDMKTKKDKSSDYTSSIKKEVSTRVSEMRVVVVKSGDTLSKIAKRAYGKALDYPRILKANPDLIKNPNNIYVGQRLRVPMNDI